MSLAVGTEEPIHNAVLLVMTCRAAALDLVVNGVLEGEGLTSLLRCARLVV